MSKQFTIRQFFRNRPAIHRHKRHICAAASVVNHARHGFFSRTTFTVNNNAVIGGRNEVNLFKKSLGGGTCANYVAFFGFRRAFSLGGCPFFVGFGGVFGFVVVAWILFFWTKTWYRDSSLNGHQNLLRQKRFSDVIERTQTHHFNRNSQIAVTRYDQNGDVRHPRFYVLNNHAAVHVAQSEIGKHQIGLNFVQQFQARFSVVGGRHFVIVLRQKPFEQVANVNVVVNNQYFFHDFLCFYSKIRLIWALLMFKFSRYLAAVLLAIG